MLSHHTHLRRTKVELEVHVAAETDDGAGLELQHAHKELARAVLDHNHFVQTQDRVPTQGVLHQALARSFVQSEESTRRDKRERENDWKVSASAIAAALLTERSIGRSVECMARATDLWTNVGCEREERRVLWLQTAVHAARDVVCDGEENVAAFVDAEVLHHPVREEHLASQQARERARVRARHLAAHSQ